MHDLVVSGAEQLVAGIVAKSALVDQGLWMLDANTDGERFWLQEDAAFEQSLEGVARAVPKGEHNVVCFDLGAVFQRDTAQMACPVSIPVDCEIDNLRAEAIFAAECFDLGAHVLDHCDKAEGADVRF